MSLFGKTFYASRIFEFLKFNSMQVKCFKEMAEAKSSSNSEKDRLKSNRDRSSNNASNVVRLWNSSTSGRDQLNATADASHNLFPNCEVSFLQQGFSEEEARRFSGAHFSAVGNTRNQVSCNWCGRKCPWQNGYSPDQLVQYHMIENPICARFFETQVKFKLEILRLPKLDIIFETNNVKVSMT